MVFEASGVDEAADDFVGGFAFLPRSFVVWLSGFGWRRCRCRGVDYAGWVWRSAACRLAVVGPFQGPGGSFRIVAGRR